jgi:phosphoribosylanthranilate isomerase
MSRVKICGNTSLADAQEAARLGAWALGVIYAEQCPRRCDPAVAAEIGAALRRRCEIVGVFVNPTLEEVNREVENAGLTMVQLSGDEGPAFCTEVARRTGAKVMKAIRVSSAAEIHGAEAFRTDFHLFDTRRPGLFGGTGQTFDWDLLTHRRSTVPAVLAGGLTPANVADAIAIASPYAVDVVSGVESEPGRKDHDALAAFFAAAQVPAPAAAGPQ